MTTTKLVSIQDRSVNYVDDLGSKQALETRYVRRTDDYFIAYLSTQTACSQGCKMCHLTLTDQTVGRDATIQELLTQFRCILDHEKQCAKAEGREIIKTVHVNFMARGEPLANQILDDHALRRLADEAYENGYNPKFLLSTIMPRNKGKFKLFSLEERFYSVQPEICYSLYSTNEHFRKQWLPAAVPVHVALDELAAWQKFSMKLVKIHHALIRGENDSLSEARKICEELNKRRMRVNINLVQYNAFDTSSEVATTAKYEEIARVYRSCLSFDTIVQIVPRVGQDVKASCGMFFEAT